MTSLGVLTSKSEWNVSWGVWWGGKGDNYPPPGPRPRQKKGVFAKNRLEKGAKILPHVCNGKGFFWFGGFWFFINGPKGGKRSGGKPQTHPDQHQVFQGVPLGCFFLKVFGVYGFFGTQPNGKGVFQT